MRRLSIRNLGPVREEEIELGRTNVIIGQAAGKSCVMKTAAFCAQVEREIARPVLQMVRGEGQLPAGSAGLYRMEGYGREDTRIGYETNLVRLGYDNSTGEFDIERKEGRRVTYRFDKTSHSDLTGIGGGKRRRRYSAPYRRLRTRNNVIIIN